MIKVRSLSGRIARSPKLWWVSFNFAKDAPLWDRIEFAFMSVWILLK